MKPLIAAIIALTVSASTGFAHAQSADFKPILPDNLLWLSPPNNAALKGAWVLGADQKPGGICCA